MKTLLRKLHLPFVFAVGLIVAFLAGCDSLHAPSDAEIAELDHAADARHFVPGRFLVVVEPGVSPAAVARDHDVHPRYVFTEAANAFAGSISEAARAGLLRDGRVVRVEPDAIVTEATTTQKNATWGLDRIDQRELPVDGQYSYTTTGRGVQAYVIDSGIRFDHVDFGGRAVRGFDAIGDGQNGNDCRGHGTHVASTVGGKEWGVAKDVGLVSIRVLDCYGRGSVSGVIAGIDWIITNNRGPAVATLSLGATKNETLNEAVRKLIASGVQVAVAAGNSDADACTFSPASTREAVTVGAAGTAHINDRQPFSNWGECVDIFAPGAAIIAASHEDTQSGVLRSGTSMAAPHVAGVMATWLETNPSMSPSDLFNAINSSSTKNVVLNSKSPRPHFLFSMMNGVELDHDGSGSGDDGTTDPDDAEPGESDEESGEDHTSEPAITVPHAPSNLALTLVALNRVDLNWSDQSSNEDGFSVERRVGSGSWSSLATLSSNSTTFSDRSVTAGETFTYRVRAFNAAGSSEALNEATVVVSCTTRGKSLNCR